jgi:hypothetical protein
MSHFPMQAPPSKSRSAPFSDISTDVGPEMRQVADVALAASE